MKRVLGLLGEERTTEGFTTAKKISTANDAIKIEKESVLKKIPKRIGFSTHTYDCMCTKMYLTI